MRMALQVNTFDMFLMEHIQQRYSNFCASRTPSRYHCSCVFLGAGVITSNSSTWQQLLLQVHGTKNATHSWQSTRPSWLAERLRHVGIGCRGVRHPLSELAPATLPCCTYARTGPLRG